jgi:hypothetical protein
MFINFSENRAVYEIMWKNTVAPDRPQMTVCVLRRMCFACWITKATDTHSEYVILIAFPLQQWSRERASILHYTYIASLVPNKSHIKRPGIKPETSRIKSAT